MLCSVICMCNGVSVFAPCGSLTVARSWGRSAVKLNVVLQFQTTQNYNRKRESCYHLLSTTPSAWICKCWQEDLVWEIIHLWQMIINSDRELFTIKADGRLSLRTSSARAYFQSARRVDGGAAIINLKICTHFWHSLHVPFISPFSA